MFGESGAGSFLRETFLILVAGEDREGSDHDQSDELGEVREIGEIGPREGEEKKDEDASQDEGGLNFIQHGDREQEEVEQEKEGGGEGTSLGHEEEHHRGEEGDVEGDRRVVEPAGAMGAEPVGAEIEEDEDGYELEGAGREERRADPDIDAGHGHDEEDGVEEETSGH